MNINIPTAANNTPMNESNISRLRESVGNQIQNYVMNPKTIKKQNNDILQECIGDIQDFSNHFTRYIDQQGFNNDFGRIDMDIILIFTMYLDWKTKNNHLLENHSIVGNIKSIDEKIGTIQRLILNKLGIEDDIINGTDPWDRIAWEIETKKTA